MNSASLKLISIITGGPPYLDRMRLLFALDPYVDEHIILTRDDPGEIPRLTNTRVLRPPCRLRGPLFSIWAGLVASHIVFQKKCSGRWLINEHFGCFASLFPRNLLWRRVAVAVSLYAPSRSLFVDKAWNADPFVGMLSPAQHRYYTNLYRWDLRRDQIAIRVADALIVNSEMIYHEIQKCYPSKPVIIMPTSVTVQPRNPVVDRAHTKGGNTGLTFLYVGNIEPRKGIGLLLEAFARHSRTRLSDRLVLVGRVFPINQEWFTHLLNDYQKSCLIDYLPPMLSDELAQQYQECDVFVFPSFYEGSPRVVKEAMVHGCPVIASDIPGTRLIDSDGRAIQYFPSGDADALASLMGHLAENPTWRSELQALSWTVVRQFSHEYVAVKLAGAYRKILTVEQAESKHRRLISRRSSG